MAICEVYSQTVSYKYKSTLCSKSTIFSTVTTILSFLLPLLVAYRSQVTTVTLFAGFWLKNSTYREQPNIHFKHDYLLYMDTDRPDQPILCSNLPFPRDFDHCTLVKSREEDNNRDGKFDELIFEAQVSVPTNVGVHSIQLILVFDYILQKNCLLQMETMGLIHYSSGLPGNSFDYTGDLKLSQKQLLSTRSRDVRYNRPVFLKKEDSTFDLNLNSVIKAYTKRNITTKLDSSYQMWTVGVLLDEPFTIKININYPEENIMYKPNFWEVMKWAWIQYFSLLFIFLNVFQRVKGYVFSNHLIPTMKEVPWKKFM